jgi:hypothetical protein
MTAVRISRQPQREEEKRGRPGPGRRSARLPGGRGKNNNVPPTSPRTRIRVRRKPGAPSTIMIPISRRKRAAARRPRGCELRGAPRSGLAGSQDQRPLGPEGQQLKQEGEGDQPQDREQHEGPVLIQPPAHGLREAGGPRLRRHGGSEREVEVARKARRARAQGGQDAEEPEGFIPPCQREPAGQPLAQLHRDPPRRGWGRLRCDRILYASMIRRSPRRSQTLERAGILLQGGDRFAKGRGR